LRLGAGIRRLKIRVTYIKGSTNTREMVLYGGVGKGLQLKP
jgi:hypothetical protein